MSSVADGKAEAFNVSVDTRDHADEVPERTPAQQAYLDEIAKAAERAVEHVEQMIKDLQESLGDRRAEAEQARADAENGRNA